MNNINRYIIFTASSLLGLSCASDPLDVSVFSPLTDEVVREHIMTIDQGDEAMEISAFSLYEDEFEAFREEMNNNTEFRIRYADSVTYRDVYDLFISFHSNGDSTSNFPIYIVDAWTKWDGSLDDSAMAAYKNIHGNSVFQPWEIESIKQRRRENKTAFRFLWHYWEKRDSFEKERGIRRLRKIF